MYLLFATDRFGIPVQAKAESSTTYSLPAGGVVYAPSGAAAPGGGQRHLQNRVSHTTIDPDPAAGGDEQTTYYTTTATTRTATWNGWRRMCRGWAANTSATNTT